MLIGSAFTVLLFIVYWFLTFNLTDGIFEKQKVKKGYRFPVIVVNTGIILYSFSLVGGSFYSYIFIFILLMVSFTIFYKDNMGTSLFCASACILHVMAIRAIVTAFFSMSLGISVYDVANDRGLLMLSINVAAVITNIAIFVVWKYIPADMIKIINQHSEQQWFMIAWMSVFNFYLVFNAKIYSEPAFHPNLAANELLAPLSILSGLYIVLFFAFKTVNLLGYKEKSAVLQQAVYQEQMYRNSATRDAIKTYEVNLSQNMILKGFEEEGGLSGAVNHRYSDMLYFMAHKLIHSEDIEKFTFSASRSSLIREFEAGKSELSMEYRRITEKGEFIWVRAVANLFKSIETGDTIAYVCIRNIEEEKNHQIKLQYKAERDPLTGLYNKEMTGKLINEKLMFQSQSNNAALFMIDIDNFKGINDHFGHVYGDVVICELADKLRHIFSEDDIIGRIGGDEYMAFMKEGGSAEVVEEKAAEICKAFYTVYNGTDDEKYIISSSVGISVSPKDGDSFEELYSHADIALYEAKNKGKNTFIKYNGQSFKGYQSKRKEILRKDGAAPGSFRQNRIEYVFKILYQSDNPFAAIHSVLELVSSHFCFGRGYIFETSKDGQTTSNTFEWCEEGVKSQIDSLQNVPIEAVSTANSHFHKEGVFILRTLKELQPQEREVLEPQGIKSMFQFGIFDHNNLLGFIGFDDCEKERVPNDMELDEITTICNILAIFFIKQRISEESANNLEALEEVMDHLENYIYVIDTETYHVLFMNEKTRKIMNSENSKEPCHRFFRGKDSQCDDCPMRILSDNPLQKASCFIYNEKLNLWLETSASYLRWIDGSTACLINCLETTEKR